MLALVLLAINGIANANSSDTPKVVKAAKDGKTHKSVKKDAKSHKSAKKSSKGNNFEVWASDQSNSVSGEVSPGMKGSFLWIWDSKSIVDQLEDDEGTAEEALPLSCTPEDSTGPCDILKIFPPTLERCNDKGCTGELLETLPWFGQLHSVLKDPSNRYVSANMFAPGGGYVGVIDTQTKEAIGLFRVTAVELPTPRSVHMSFWTADGSAIIVSNLHGKLIERIDVARDNDGTIKALEFNTDASIYLGKNFQLSEAASYFQGMNAFGRPLIGSIFGSYDDADTSDLTPSGACKETGCPLGSKPFGGARTNNVPICPIPSPNGNGYITLGGGGLFVLKFDTTPMQIIGEYGNKIVNGAGVVGVQVKDHMFLNTGISASAAGLDQSTFGLYAFDDTKFSTSDPLQQNNPMPIQVFKDPTNTNTIGNIDGTKLKDETGQIPAFTTRRDSHGVSSTIDGKYIHVFDRLQNIVEVFDSETYNRVNTYDLVSMDGKSGRTGPSGPCLTKSVMDDPGLTLNDPTPDLLEITPDGKYFTIAFRGPKPVSVPHSAQGSCPGVGIVEITENGRSGRLVDVLRTTNTVDTVPVGTISGGHDYTGVERSDIHNVITISKYT